MEKKIKKLISRVNIAVPTDLLNIIDNYVEENFLTRNKWFLDAINLKMEKDRLKMIDKIVKNSN
jgi:metal-responsive CopG/Arc/MetJ family transcriptional regulator